MKRNPRTDRTDRLDAAERDLVFAAAKLGDRTGRGTVAAAFLNTAIALQRMSTVLTEDEWQEVFRAIGALKAVVERQVLPPA